MRRILLSALSTAALVGALVANPGPALAGEAVYVALGDSAAAGPLIPNQIALDPCWRSDRNYPHVAAARLDAGTFRDVTCSGAKTDHMTQSQGGVAPQFDALSADTTLVTLTIGGNDTGLVGLAESCVRLSPFDRPCIEDNVVDGVDRVKEQIDAYAPKLAAVLDGIHARSPQARVLVVGYGTYVKPRGCWPIQPVLPVDADYLQGKVDYLNEVTRREAAAHNATYVDIRTPSIGHDACQRPDRKWLEGFVPTSPAMPLHPNARGMANFGQIVAGSAGSALV